ncbi:ATP-binding cassette domain-containing protein [Shewanella japonica]|uniref:ABC transporter n=1 Tax=Shewanella japonica TaxID=93973 RepID=A0ABM6JN13_9GAMM|nr:ABC transporter ATP-binding protein [Shewanella japonica]ARD22834.1 ABC transporter [Shewanella japonica]
MTLLALHEVSFRHQSSSVALFKQLNFTVIAGECHCICGETGAGKSSLLQLMAMPSEFDFKGEILHSDGLRLGLVMQDPHIQLIRETVGAEVAFGLENLAFPAPEMLQLVLQALQQVGLDLPLDTQVSNLSLGQKYRLMLAAQLVLRPNVIFIDEPWAQLDDAGVVELNEALKQLVDSGVSVVMTEHHSAAFSQVINTHWLLKNGVLNKQDKAPIQKAETCPLTHLANKPQLRENTELWRLNMPAVQAITVSVQTDIRLAISPLTVQFTDKPPLIELSQELQLYAGEMVGLFGENGCGKTSLLNQIVGIDDKNQHAILMLGKPVKLGTFGQDLGFLMQRPSRQLFEVSVQQEVEFSLKRFGLPVSRASEILTQLNISHLAAQSPHKLSYGQQHLVALASVLCLKPKVLLLDDPFAGLDSQYFSYVIDALTDFCLQGGAILITSHRPIMKTHLSKVWQIAGGKLTQCFQRERYFLHEKDSQLEQLSQQGQAFQKGQASGRQPALADMCEVNL